ncbi:hypothetical protein TNCV_3891341 [Trichonephila clavipes]|nr:hypothetical protein TNCV_3891341 [Trichonephila clavipes]
MRVSTEEDFVDQRARKGNAWRILGRRIRTSNRFPIIPGTLPDNATQPCFRHTVPRTYLKSLGERKHGP